MSAYFHSEEVTVHHGDCIQVMTALAEESVHAIVTDPPYGLEFMGREWDGADGFRRSLNTADVGRDSVFGRSSRTSPEYRAGHLFEEWTSTWAAEALRVLKPGGHLLAFGGSRTWHRLAAGIEDAGFEIRDSIAWMYGSGFPKSMDVSKAIEKGERGDLVRAKLMHFAAERGVDGNWLEENGIASAASFADWTTGGHVPSDKNWQIVKNALEVTSEEEEAFEREVVSDGRSRIDDGTVYGLGHTGRKLGGAVTAASKAWEGWGTALKPAFEPIVVARKPLVGTVAANVLQYGTGALNIDATRVKHRNDADLRESAAKNQHARFGTAPGGNNVYGDYSTTPVKDYDGSAGRWPTNVVLDESQAAALDEQAPKTGASTIARAAKAYPVTRDTYGASADVTPFGHDELGGASRFFPTFRYEAKAPTAERPKAGEVAHPTVKPLDLMRWLVRLVTPPGGVLLDPFAGSGTTLEAAVLEGFTCIGIEREAAYLPLITSRLTKPLLPSLFGDWEVSA